MTVVNDCLGISQYVSGSMNEDQAISYLLAIEKLTLQDWKTAKLLLAKAEPTNRQTREATVRDVVNYFKNELVEEEYLVKDLSILPGLSKQALELISFNLSTLYAINLSRQQHIQPSSETRPAGSSRTDAQGTLNLLDNTRRQVQQQSEYNEAFPRLATSEIVLQISAAAAETRSSPSPPNEWSLVEKARRQRDKSTDKRKKIVVQGTSKSENAGINHPLRFVCLAIRSGTNETEATLESELRKWNCLTELKVELVRESCFLSFLSHFGA